MYSRTRRRLTLVCFCGLILCLLFIFIMTVCDQTAGEQNLDKVKKEAEIESYHVRTNLLIVVLSAPSHIEVRNVIRQTWAKDLPRGTCVLFMVGSKNLPMEMVKDIWKENDTHEDIIFLNEIEESYTVLTRKLLETLNYAFKFIKFNFLMKVDEDSFVRVDKVLQELLAKPQERLYWGFFDGRAHVHKSGKWKETDYVLCDRYIPYALGGGYVISKDLVEHVAKNSAILQLFNSEDVSLGTWLGPLNIHRIHDVNFDTEYKSRGCFDSYIVTHKKQPEELKLLQHNLDTVGKLCVTESRVRLSYNYNWMNLPTKCCERSDTKIP